MRKKTPKITRQPNIGYRRKPVGSAVDKKIEAAINKEMERYPGVSRSFVIANALAFTFGIDIETYK